MDPSFLHALRIHASIKFLQNWQTCGLCEYLPKVFKTDVARANDPVDISATSKTRLFQLRHLEQPEKQDHERPLYFCDIRDIIRLENKVLLYWVYVDAKRRILGHDYGLFCGDGWSRIKRLCQIRHILGCQHLLLVQWAFRNVSSTWKFQISPILHHRLGLVRLGKLGRQAFR